MKHLAILLMLAATGLVGQIAPGQFPVGQPAAPTEQSELRRALSEAGNSPVELARAIEHHLRQYPNAPQKVEL
ncbi:MAG TPA: hypothetical protein VF146_12765, partial [Bryobacteraceae bacterium]